MKQIRIMAIVFTALMLAVLVFALCLGNSLSFRRRDIGEYNDMIFRINEEYRAGTAVGDLEEKYRCRIILSRELVDSEMTQYYAGGALVLDFAPEGEILGKVVWNDRQEAWQEQADQLRRTLLMIWGLVLAAGWLFILVAWITVAKPIREFEGFAGEVAKGNLEVQLPRRRLNLFGNFTESFDLMREELRDSREREVRANKAMREMAGRLQILSRERIVEELNKMLMTDHPSMAFETLEETGLLKQFPYNQFLMEKYLNQLMNK